MRLPLGGGQEEVVLDRVRPFLWSVTDTGIVFVTREQDFDAMDVYRFSDRQVARVGRLGFRIPGIFTTHDGVPRRALGVGHENGAVRFRHHAARQLSITKAHVMILYRFRP